MEFFTKRYYLMVNQRSVNTTKSVKYSDRMALKKHNISTETLENNLLNKSVVIVENNFFTNNTDSYKINKSLLNNYSGSIILFGDLEIFSNEYLTSYSKLISNVVLEKKITKTNSSIIMSK